MKIGVLIYTYNRTDDARVNMEIIRKVWSNNEDLRDVIIAHSFNGQQEWWPDKYLEDELLRLENPGHFGGAEILINDGFRLFCEKYPDVDYVIVLASDTWLVKPNYVAGIIRGMREVNKTLAVCAWGSNEHSDMFKIGMSLDFFVVNKQWAADKGLLPIRYKEFVEKYSEIYGYQDIQIFPERVFALRFKQAVLRSVQLPSENLTKKAAQEYLYHLIDREPVHHNVRDGWFSKPRGERIMYWPKIGLLTHHNAAQKQKDLQRWGLELGEHGKKFLESADLSYFNQGVRKIEFEINGKKLNYGD